MSATTRDLDGLTVLITAGGTGGHVYPALAVAAELGGAGARVEWLGTAAGLEAELVPRTGIPIHYVSVGGVRGKGPLRWLGAPLVLALAVLRALGIVRRVRPGVVLGMGGYAAAPGGLAARILGVPLVIHEQNARAGLTNRLLARFACRVLEAFPGTFEAARRAVHTGNPVRADIAALPAPENRLAGREGPLRVLVLGGSQGARALNEVVPLALAALADRRIVELRHQAGVRQLESAVARYAAVGVEAQPVAFIDDMAAAYEWADLVVCRAGAMTVTELAAAGAAAVLVPYPHAVDDHQTHNARYLSDAGAALLVPQAELDAWRLAGILSELHGARERLLAMARAARRLAVPDAAARVVSCCLEVARA